MDESTQGSTAVEEIMPTLATSMENTAAVRGVPNTAANTALMPHMVTSRVSPSESFNSRLMAVPRPPPICSAAPSRPADPPQRWVRKVPEKISAARRAGTLSCSLVARSTASVPGSFSIFSRA